MTIALTSVLVVSSFNGQLVEPFFVLHQLG